MPTMKKKLHEYSYEELLGATTLSDVVVYDIPVATFRDGKMTKTPFSLTEKQAGEILERIVADHDLLAAMRIKLTEADKLDSPPPVVDGAHPQDENLKSIENIVHSIAPSAPTNVVSWFAARSYEMLMSERRS